MSVQRGDESGGPPELACLESFGEAPRRPKAQRMSAVSSQQAIEGQALRDDDRPLTEFPPLAHATETRGGRGPAGGDHEWTSLGFDYVPGCDEARTDPLRDGYGDCVADQLPAQAFLGDMGRPACAEALQPLPSFYAGPRDRMTVYLAHAPHRGRRGDA